MNKVWFYVTTAWRSATILSIGVVVVVGLLFFNLQGIPGGSRPDEIATAKQNATIKQIYEQPVYAPYYFARNAITKVNNTDPVIKARYISAFIALLVVVSYCLILRLWYSPRVVLLGVALLASSSWLLRIGRSGTPDAMQMLYVPLIMLIGWHSGVKHKRLAILASACIAGVLLYIPGVFWLLLAGVIWRGPIIWPKIKTQGWVILTLAGVLASAIATPLVMSVVNQPSSWRTVLGINSLFDFGNLLGATLSLPKKLFFVGPPDAFLSIGRLPMVDIFTFFMIAVGVYSALRNHKLDRNKMMLGLLAVGSAVSILGGSPTFAILLPAVYLLSVSGIAYMLEEWLTIFPKNPLARGIANYSMIFLVICASYFHISNYFVAWPKAPATKALYGQNLIQ